MDLKKFFREYGEYYPSEKRGVVYLAVIIALWIAGLYVYSRIPLKVEEDRDFERAVASYYQQLQTEERRSESAGGGSTSKLNLFEFDPNTISFDSLQLMGLEPSAAKAIVNYRKSGGYFKEPGDLERIYTLDQETYSKLAPHIRIKSVSEISKEKSGKGYSTSQSQEDEAEQIVPIDINLADTNQLKEVPGIGSYYAREIVRHRILFGGYLSLEQLLEIDLYLFDMEKLDEIAPYLVVDTTHVQKIDLNRVSLDELRQHPYFPYSIANSVVKMREAHGPYKKIGDIRRSHLVNDSIFERVKPYLVIHE